VALAQRLIDVAGTAIVELSELFGRLVRGGFVTFFFERRGEMKPSADLAMRAILDNPDVPENIKSLIRGASGDSNAWDWITYVLMQIGGILSVMGAMGQPAAQAVSTAQWQTTPVKLEDPSTLITEYFRGRRSRKDIGERMLAQGYNEQAQEAMIATARPLIDLNALRELELRDAAQADRALEDAHKAGWTDDQIAALRVLYWRIPPAQDLITMAVREVFTPEIAEKFGQFEDFPGAFARYGAMQGISEEWAKRYWAAHWNLPSASQGFEMLHRGLITDEDLDMLLRALDVMPFWRDRLKSISWNIPTRVDIRRMYKIGIYTKEDVKNTYVKAGYKPEDAEALAEFTVRYYAADETDSEDDERVYTKSEILTGYRTKVLDETTTRELLGDLGYQEDQVDFYLKQQDLKLDQALRDAYMTRYKTLFVQGIMDIGGVKAALDPVGITAAEIDVELPLWQLDKITRVARPTKAELKRWVEKGLIDPDTWYSEMRVMGYEDPYIDLYWKEVEIVEPEA
jgi:hypothetical protein